MATVTPEDAAKLLLAWETNWTTTLIKFAVLTLVFFIILIALFQFANVQEITKNFPRYRCNPIIMPFAGNFGYDATENFNFCLNNIFQGKAIEVFAPLYELLNLFTGIVSQIVNVVLGIRKLFSNFLFGVNRFVRNVRDRIQQLMTSVRMSFLRINNLMGRVYGTMYAVMWMGLSALATGNNIAQNDLVKFLFEFCFDPNTPVRLADNTVIPLSQVTIGTVLAPIEGNNRPVVTSVLRFDGKKTPMVRIHQVLLSAEHYVNHSGRWIPAKDHPEAVMAESIPVLACLNVSGHSFGIGPNNLVVSDYDEHSLPGVVTATQRLALSCVSGKEAQMTDTLDDYSLGIDGTLLVQMKDTSWKYAKDVAIGDIVMNSGRILGIVHESCTMVADIDGKQFASAQLIFDGKKQNWSRCGLSYTHRACKPTVLYSFITEHCSVLSIHTGKSELFIRDYREAAIPEMEDAYSNQFMSGSPKSEVLIELSE